MTEQTQQRVEDWLSTSYRDLPKSSERLGDLRRRLDETGVAELEDFLTPEAHDLLKKQILDLESAAAGSEQSGHKKFALKGEQLQNTVVDGLARSSYMLELANGLLQAGRPDRPGRDRARNQHHAWPRRRDGVSLRRHVPEHDPPGRRAQLEGPRRGQLILYPNIRSFRKSFWDRKVVPALVRVPPLRRIWKRREVDYKERGAYLFYGYRTYHGVESPAEPGLRAVTNMTVGGAALLAG